MDGNLVHLGNQSHAEFWEIRKRCDFALRNGKTPMELRSYIIQCADNPQQLEVWSNALAQSVLEYQLDGIPPSVNPGMLKHAFNEIWGRTGSLVELRRYRDQLFNPRDKSLFSSWVQEKQDEIEFGRLEFYNWEERIQDESTGILLLGSAGAAKTTVARHLGHLLTKDSPAKCLAIDPHANLNHWEKFGIPAIGNNESGSRDMETAMELCLKELERRRTMEAEEVESLPPWLIFADELSAALAEFSSDGKLVTDFMNRLGCQGRKYRMTLIGIIHNTNSFEKQNRDNYVLIGLRTGVEFVTRGMKWDSPAVRWLGKQPYACAVKAGQQILPAKHPTHWHHTSFRQRGNAPHPSASLNVNSLPFSRSEGELEKWLLSSSVTVRWPKANALSSQGSTNSSAFFDSNSTVSVPNYGRSIDSAIGEEYWGSGSDALQDDYDDSIPCDESDSGVGKYALSTIRELPEVVKIAVAKDWQTHTTGPSLNCSLEALFECGNGGSRYSRLSAEISNASLTSCLEWLRCKALRSLHRRQRRLIAANWIQEGLQPSRAVHIIFGFSPNSVESQKEIARITQETSKENAK